MLGLVSATLADNGAIELGYALSPLYWGKGLATEAAMALVDAVFALTEAPEILANSRVINPASRRVLEKCGFAYVDTGLDPLPARGGMHPCERFRLDRHVWAMNRRPRRMPSMEHQAQQLPEPAE